METFLSDNNEMRGFLPKDGQVTIGKSVCGDTVGRGETAPPMEQSGETEDSCLKRGKTPYLSCTVYAQGEMCGAYINSQTGEFGGTCLLDP